VDSGVEPGSEISGLYDPLVAKLCVWDVDRESARRRMLRALEEFVIEGPTTLLGFHRALLSHPCFVDGGTCHGLVESELLAEAAQAPAAPSRRAARSPGRAARTTEREVSLEIDGRRYDVRLVEPEPAWRALARRRAERTRDGSRPGGDASVHTVVSPMQGTVLAVEVAEGDEVSPGQVICVVEAMKMENEITAHGGGVVGALAIAPGDPVRSGQVICVLAGALAAGADDGEEPALEP
jgi:acetyl-CoA/propionyl-CoA carboxylase biotin carboxyl carrier protein